MAAACERVVPLDDDARASFRFHEDAAVPAPLSTDVTDGGAATSLRDLYAASVALPTCFNVLDSVVPKPSRCFVYFVGHRSDNGDWTFDVHAFGDKSSFYDLLTCAAGVAGVDFTEVHKHFLAPRAFPVLAYALSVLF